MPDLEVGDRVSGLMILLVCWGGCDQLTILFSGGKMAGGGWQEPWGCSKNHGQSEGGSDIWFRYSKSEGMGSGLARGWTIVMIH